MANLSFKHISDYPSDRETDWSEEVQGVTHNDNHWFITQKDRIWKIPVDVDLNSDISDGDPGILTAPIPAELSGYNHFGDIDYYDGHLFVGAEKPNHTNARIACFDANSLEYIGSALVPELNGHCAWCAVNPADGLIYSSWFDDVSQLYAYKFYFEVSYDETGLPQVILFGLEFDHTVSLNDENNNPLTLQAIQGGVFSFINGENHLYLSSNKNDDDMRGFHVFSFPDVKRFGFVFIDKEYLAFGEEIEGITYWDLDGGPAPGIAGQVHVLELDNDTLTSDDIKCFKHYRTISSEYVANKNPSKKEVHKAECEWINLMKPVHKVPYQTLQEALDDGYDGCHYCLGEYDKR
jgi:hypothetical protein